METPHIVLKTNLVLQLIQELQIKSKTVMSWSSGKKKDGIFCTAYFVRRKFYLTFVFFFSMYSVLHTLSEYTYFYIIKKYCFIHCFWKSSKAFSVSLKLQFLRIIHWRLSVISKTSNKVYEVMFFDM